MAEKKILISVDENETRIALIESGNLEDFLVERKDEHRIAGSIYKGVVKKVLPGMQSAFIDIGLGRDGFLYVSQVTEGIDVDEKLPVGSIESKLKEGQEILVQVLREPIGTKGARLSSYVSLPGRYLVLMPSVVHLGVSRKITGEDERKRLKELLRTVAPPGKGLIVRTAGESRGERDFRADVKYLMRVWSRIEKLSRRAAAPMLVHEELDAASRVVRDMLEQEVNKIVIDAKQQWARLKKFVRILCPDLPVKVELYRGEEPLFEAYDVEKEIENALSRHVTLKSGGYLVIEQTEAMVSIDVNTGRYKGKKNFEDTILKTNLEAASEVARQLRLRDMGGIVIIDFIDMESPGNRKKVLRKLEECVKRDKAKTTILELSDLGLVEMTRQRVRKSLSSTLYEICPYCKGSGMVRSVITTSINVQRKLKRLCRITEEKQIRVKVHTEVAGRLLNEDRTKIVRLERQFRKKLLIESDPSLHIEEVIFP